MSTHVAPVALPAPESAPKSGAADARPDVGPVLPLSSGGGEHGDLLGAADHPSDKTPDPTAAKVLSRGEALAAPVGRADDFSWPHPGASTTPDIAPQPTASNPAAPEKKVDEAKKPTDVGKDNKNKAGKESARSTTRRSRNTDLDGAQVPPAPVGLR
jgi:hypothetical protein